MRAILKAKWQLFLRTPWTFITMTILILIFAYLIGGLGMDVKHEIPVFTNIKDVEKTETWSRITESEVFEFQLTTETEAKQALEDHRVEAIVFLDHDDFKVYVATETPNANLLYQFLQSAYTDLFLNESIIEAAEEHGQVVDIVSLQEDLAKQKENPLFSIQSEYFYSDKTVKVDMNLQSLFGFTLFFVIYTIAYNVLFILQEKQSGIWNRMILSPLKKWQMYMGNLLYSFAVGYIQVVAVFALFRYVIGIDFYGGFAKTLLILIPYVFCIVALSLCVVSISKNEQHFNVLIPLISVSFGMLGGAYWPLEIVTSDIMLFLSKLIPITYGMEALKLATLYQMPVQDLLPSMAVLVFMGVVLMGIGINVMEKRSG